MKNLITLILLWTVASYGYAQTQINESIPFQSDDSKDYSLVIPSSYVEGSPVAAFLALHPLNTSRWNGETWCEELTEFAETNDLILVCPDGGVDGAIDDPIDTAFTTFILDSAMMWYDVDPTQVYITGFSWGGKTTYTYGLQHISKFAGLMPIGAAVSISEVTAISDAADGKPFYMIHGSLDSPNSRLYPLIDEMESNGACVESNLLAGVGHTIDFANQLEILTAGYDYLREQADCGTTSVDERITVDKKILVSNLIVRGDRLDLVELGLFYQIYDQFGRPVYSGDGEISIDFATGVYIIAVGDLVERFFVSEN